MNRPGSDPLLWPGYFEPRTDLRVAAGLFLSVKRLDKSIALSPVILIPFTNPEEI